MSDVRKTRGTAPIMSLNAYENALTQFGQAAEVLGLTGFGGSGHLVLQMARHLYPDSPVVVFARSQRERQFALELGADWSGDTEETPPKAPKGAEIRAMPPTKMAAMIVKGPYGTKEGATIVTFEANEAVVRKAAGDDEDRFAQARFQLAPSLVGPAQQRHVARILGVGQADDAVDAVR